MRRFMFAVFVGVLAAFQTPPRSLSSQAGERPALNPLPGASVTVLVDNMAGGGPVLGEWGVSFLVETGQHRILFDTGAGQVLLGNARALGIDLRGTEAIVISHGHDDHTAGLEKAIEACGPVNLFVHPVVFDTRYWKDDSGAVAFRLPLSREQLGQRVRKLIETKEATAICEGVMVSGQIPRVTDFEDTGVRRYAFLDESLKTPDPILDDQAIFFRVPEGVVILLGCGHAGLVNTMRYVSELTGEREIYAVMGGTHLLGVSPRRMKETVAALKRYRVQRILLSHCTGLGAYAEFATAFPGRCSWPASGTRVLFGKQ
jgi:7,8-dihydropterin-6-yl-methyl-4-(beta-D-ribofuranosyl)aminobenzene 5'-phosphate synthase